MPAAFRMHTMLDSTGQMWVAYDIYKLYSHPLDAKRAFMAQLQRNFRRGLFEGCTHFPLL